MCERGDTEEVIIDGKSISVDRCIALWVRGLNVDPTTITLGSCCGHGRYPTTIVVTGTEAGARHYDIVSGRNVPRRRKFYKLDDDGYYYIPETIE